MNLQDRNNYMSVSRYKNLKRIVDEDGFEYLETPNKIKIEKKGTDFMHKVESGEEDRLDLIAVKYYQNASLYWVIAEANDMDNPLKVEVGTVLRIPSLSSVFGFKGVL